MPLFQKSVVAKQLQSQDKTQFVARWNLFKSHFHNPSIQDNIRSSKEEQYQGEFLIDLFVNVLGYTKNPTPNFNLTTEYKNVKDSKKADGAVLTPASSKGEGEKMVKAVIELKGTNTTDLNKIEVQAFGYKNNQPDCVYVITSNFEKLRFYIDNATEYVEFNLFTLTEKEFELLYLCLAYENIANDIPKKLKEQSLSQEKDITKALYTDYSLFKRELHHDLVQQNPDYDALELFQKSQKLLDRFLFIFFAEDRNLLPTNLIFRINQEWRQLQEMRMNISLYNRYKIYFNDLNQGAKVVLPAFSATRMAQKEEHQIFAYNGGLFQADTVLDHIKIDNELLYRHTQKLSNYDFQSEVDVNILGHIFENSLNELDEVKTQLEGGIPNPDHSPKEKGIGKRKKDGVFYTPKYITKYIVDNTVGKLCTDKKAELQIMEEDYFTDKKRNKLTKQPLSEKLTEYRNWLLQITICDPACGSGAFLNQALDFLIAEHGYIDELQAKLFGDGLIMSDVEKSILENNLFGVDLNEESVEIAKLSLWLRTAQPNRKLNDLNSNIQCGNSLIDDVAIAGDKAFNWQTAFPKIFEKGGFDVIIGNPPYVLCQPSNTDEKTLDFYKNFEVASYKIDLFHLFFESSIKHLKEKGKLGFITPNTYLTNKYIQKMRNYILNNTKIEILVNYEDAVFFDASVDVATIILNKEKCLNETIQIFNSKLGIIEGFGTKKQIDWLNESENTFNIKKELEINFDNCVKFDEIGNSYFGIQAFDRKTSISAIKENDDFLPMIDGAEINRYELSNPNKYFNFISANIKSGGDYSVYSKLRIVVRQIGQTPIIGICEPNIVTSNTLYNLYLTDENYSLKYVLTIFNSKLIKKYWLSNYSDSKQLFPKIKGYQLKQLPVKILAKELQTPFIEKADLMLSLNKDLQEQSQKFQRTIQRKFFSEEQNAQSHLSKKLQDWYVLSYGDFIKELGKKKIKLSLSQEAEWEEYFTTEAQKVLEIKTQIDITDKAIDGMVYELYGLSEEEIEIVEKS
jgi:type I restriction-modification system DNA methylase subunit